MLSEVALPSNAVSLKLPPFDKFASLYLAKHIKLFSLYIAPVALKNLLPSEIYYNLLCYVLALRLMLLPEMPSNAEERRPIAALARSLIIIFCERLPSLYDESFETHNAHLSLHLPEKMERFGRLSEFGSFGYEGFISYLMQFYAGTLYQIDQMARFVLLKKILDSFSDPSSESAYSGFNFSSLTDQVRSSVLTLVGQDFSNFYSKIPFKNTFLMSYCRSRGPEPRLPRSHSVRSGDKIYEIVLFLRKKSDQQLYALGAEMRTVASSYLLHAIRRDSCKSQENWTYDKLSDLCECEILLKELKKFTQIHPMPAYSKMVLIPVIDISAPCLIISVGDQCIAVDYDVDDEIF